MDFGCGSGVLTVGALALGAAKATCVDVEAEALVVTNANLELNELDHRAELLHVREVVPGGLVPQADVVVANILVGQLVRPSMVGSLCTNLVPGGLLCLSGIRPEEVDSLKEAYGDWMEWDASMYAEADPGEGGQDYWGRWARLIGRRVVTAEQTALLSESAVS